MKNPKIVGFALSGKDGISFTVRGDGDETCTLEFNEFQDVAPFDNALIGMTQSVMPAEYAERILKERMEKVKGLMGGMGIRAVEPNDLPRIGFGFDPKKVN